MGVLAGDESADGGPDVVDGLVYMAEHDLLLGASEEVLDHPVGLGFADDRQACGDAPQFDLPLEMVGPEVAAVIVAQLQATGGAGVGMTEALTHGHAKGLRRLEAGAAFVDMPTEQSGVPVLDDAE